ncbi:hypothetical protein HK405_000456, partial [Cladochytrium tenue]
SMADATTTPTEAPLQFDSLAGRLRPELLAALRAPAMAYSTATPVQQCVLRDLLPSAYAADCLVQAKTGTGKTLAFLLPALHRLLLARESGALPSGHVGILVLAPTRELVSQIADECTRVTALCVPKVGCHAAFGGVNKDPQVARLLAEGPAVVVASPGRLLDYLSSPDRSVRDRFRHMLAFVLDEADRLLEHSFLEDLVKIIQLLPKKATARWQGMCFSATMPARINEVLHHVLTVDHLRISTVSASDVPTVDAIPQSLVAVASIADILPTLHALLAGEQADDRDLKAVIFVHTARNASLIYQL